MARAMVKAVAFLCLALLVAHVQSARLLQQYDPAGVTAETYPSQDAPVADVFADTTEVPVTGYKYNAPADTTPSTEEAFTDEGAFATDEVLEGDTSTDTPPANSYVFEAQHEDGPDFNPDDTTTTTTTQDVDALADQDVVQSSYDSTSFASEDTREFEFQETADTDRNQEAGSVIFAFDDSLTPPFGN